MTAGNTPGHGRLAGKVCVIAGAAGAIGKAVARRLTSEGATVVGVDRRSHAVGALSLVADLSVEPEVQDVFARIHHETGRIDVIHNNAGLVDPADSSALGIRLSRPGTASSLPTSRRRGSAASTAYHTCCKTIRRAGRSSTPLRSSPEWEQRPPRWPTPPPRPPWHSFPRPRHEPGPPRGARERPGPWAD